MSVVDSSAVSLCQFHGHDTNNEDNTESTDHTTDYDPL